MRRFIPAILATVTLALTIGFVPGFVPGSSPGANAGVVGPDVGDTMGFRADQIEAAVYYPAITRGQEAHTIAIDVDDDGNVYSVTNWAISRGQFGDLGAGAAIDKHYGYVHKAGFPRVIVHKVDPNGVELWSWELNGRGYDNYDHFDDVQNDRAVGYDATGGYGEVSDIVVDDDGNTYVVGKWSGDGVVQEDRQLLTAVDGDISVHAKTGSDGWVASIDPDGNTRWVKVLHSWGRNYGSQFSKSVLGYSWLHSVDVDNNGSVVVAGRFTQTIHPIMDNIIDHPHVGELTDWKNWTGNWDDTLPENGMPNKALWDSSHHPETAYTSTTSPYVAKLNASDGSHQWHYIWNTCQKNQASTPADVKFLSDGDIVLVGGYNYEARYQKHGESCADHSLDGETTQHMVYQRSQVMLLGDGARSNIVKLSGEGDFMWGREFGSTNNVNVATELAVDPNNDDLYIVGLWELWNDDTAPSNPMFGMHSAHYMAPSAPANHADYPEIPAPNLSSVNLNANMTASDHEGQPHAATCWPCLGKAGQQVNQDTYLLHTDKHGNYITHETYDVAGVKEDKPGIDINSDGTELVIAGTGLPQCSAKHTSFRREAAGWVMGIDLETTLPESYRDHAPFGPADTNLSAKWITITEPEALPVASPSCGAGVEMKNASNRWRDVAFGPNGNVYAGGGWYNQVKFGETAAGEEVLSHATLPVHRADAAVVRFDSEGNVAGLTVPPPGDVAPDGYGIVTGPTLFEEDNSWGPGEHFLMDVGSEVVWHEPLCKGGRWEVTAQPEIAVRQYMILKQHFTDFKDLIGAPETHDGEYVAAYIRTYANNSPSVNPSTVPNYNILWLSNFIFEEDGGSSDWPDTFKLLGWDDGVADLDDPSDLPVGFYFRNGVFTYNTNSGSDTGPSVYEPATEVEGHSWDLDLYDTYLAFAHPGGGSQWMAYPEFEQKGCEPGQFTLCSGTAFNCMDTYGFVVSKDSVTTTEDGTFEEFTVVLEGPTYLGFTGPAADVVMNVVNTDATEVDVDVTRLVFTPENWNVPQKVRVTGLDDSIPDGDITSYVNIDIDHDASSYEYAVVPNQFVTVVNENGTEPDDLLPPPENPDLDGDGILNENEVDGCVLLADCDGDGINDGNEIFACMLAADCDGDGVGDNDEISQACIQDPSCTDVVENPDDPEPIVVDPPPITPPNPDPPEEPEIVTPDPPDNPQPPTPEPDPPIDDPEDILDTDGDGVPDDLEEIGCESTPDCDGDGIPDGDDDAPGNPDRDNDGLPDGEDPDSNNPDSDGDGIPDGEDSDADGDGVLDCPTCDRDNDGIPDGEDSDNSDLINPDNPGVAPGGGDPNDPAGPSDTDDTDDEAPPPVQTPDVKSPGRGLADRLGDLPLAAVAATAALAVAAAAAAAASLAGPSLLSWLFRGSLGVWLFGLLFGRRGVRCSSCDLKLVKQAGLWVDKDTQWVVGINNHTHVPADFSDKDRDKYVTAVQQILHRSDR